MTSDTQDPYNTGQDPTAGGNWWEGPAPSGYTGPWPPPLAPGASYGPNFGQVINGQAGPGGQGGTPDTNLPSTFSPDTNLTYGPQTTNNPPAVTGGTTGGGTTGGGGSLGSLIQPFTGAPPSLPGTGTPYIPPTPTFTPPGYAPPPAFKFDAFKGPTPQDVLNDPGYQFRLGQGEQALQQGAAAKGTLNGGATQKAILGYGQDYASNEFNNVWNRDLTAYNTNFGTALGQYNTNYQSQYLDPYKFAYQGAQDAFAPQMTGYQTQAAAGQHQSDLNYADAWNQYLQTINNFRDQRDSTFNKQYSVATA